MSSASCIFCRIVRGEAAADILHADEAITAFRDTNPQAPTHILIVPNRHITAVDALEDADVTLIGRLVLLARDLAQREGIASGGYRLVINNGAQAGQSVDHLHWHLLGGRRLRWPPG